MWFPWKQQANSVFVVSRAQIQRKSDQKDKLDPEKQPALEENDLKLSEGESTSSPVQVNHPPPRSSSSWIGERVLLQGGVRARRSVRGSEEVQGRV